MILALLIAGGFASCGVERQDVKVLRDRGAKKLTQPQKATVEQLLALRPPRWWRWAPRHEVERNVAEVDVEVLAFKSEPDGDVHAIIRGGRGQVMVAEFPSVICTIGSQFAVPMQQARLHFDQLARRGVQRMRVTGVIFFDKVHGQTGGAANGVELHPVLKVEALKDR